jgi:4-hydroxy-tetrahydrodipicolinate synthase
MTQFVPKGIIPAMVTPIDGTGRINEGALRKLTNHLIDGGVQCKEKEVKV